MSRRGEGDIWLVEIVDVDRSNGVGAPDLATLRLATRDGFVTTASETPAHTVWVGALEDPGNLRRALYGPRSTGRRTESARGVVTLRNDDGVLDGWAAYAIDGRAVLIRRGPFAGTYPDDFPVVARAVADQWLPGWKVARLVLVDAAGAVADRLVQTETFAGDNSLPDGVEGTADDWGGAPKPDCYGAVFNVNPPLVNTVRFIYQLSARQVAAITDARDGGVSLTPGVDRGTLAALQATAPTAGQYDYALTAGGSWVRLESLPEYDLTVDFAEGATAADRTAGQIAARILIGPGMVAPGDFDDGSADMLDLVSDAVCGVWVPPEDVRCGDLLDRVLAGVAGYWVDDADGGFQVGALSLPGGSAGHIVRAWQILDDGQGMQRLEGRAAGDRLPVWRVRVRYGRNWYPQPIDRLATEVSQADAERYRREWLEATASNAAILDLHPRAGDLVVETALQAKADADDLAALLLTWYGAPRDIYAIAMAADQAADIALGDDVTVEVDRLGMDAGRDFRVVGRVHEFGDNRVTLEVWG